MITRIEQLINQYNEFEQKKNYRGMIACDGEIKRLRQIEADTEKRQKKLAEEAEAEEEKENNQ